MCLLIVRGSGNQKTDTCILTWMVPESWVPSTPLPRGCILWASLGTEGRAARDARVGGASRAGI